MFMVGSLIRKSVDGNNALSERTFEAGTPATRRKRSGVLVRLLVCLRVEIHSSRMRRRVFANSDSKFDIPVGLAFDNCKVMKPD
jgi:hypothetical protein